MTAFSPSTLPETSADTTAARHSLPRSAPRRTRRRRLTSTIAVVATALLLGVPTSLYFRGSGLKTAFLDRVGYKAKSHPSVTLSRPGKDDSIISCDGFIAADVLLPNAGAIVDAATVHSGSVRLVRRGDNSIVPARVNTTAAGDAIVLTPTQPLQPNTYYKFEVLPALHDTSGASFKHYSVSFTTGGAGQATNVPIAFEKVFLPQTDGHMFTGVTVGPDGKLYGCTYDGSIFCYDLAADGTIVAGHAIDTVKAACGASRIITGICFDPKSTASSPVLYVSHGQSARIPADDWTGKISRLTGPDLANYQDVVTGLPRASRDHLNNQMAFGPDGALYLAQGSNTAMGGRDSGWGMRPERLLSACIMRIDLDAIAGGSVNVKTEDGGTYDPFAVGAPVTIYASGLRNAYDLLWHSNGRLYAPINGSAAGGNTPASPVGDIPALDNLRLTIPDHLALVRPGSYHGHPNPARGQYVLMAGNMTGGRDVDEIKRYPIGTRPDPKWDPPVLEFGRNLAPCGITEYRSLGTSGFSDLNGAMLVCRYSGGKDICVIVPNSDGSIREMMTGIDGLTRFADPLDITQHPKTGHLYVAELGGKRITLVRAQPHGLSARVYRQPLGPNREPMDAAQPASKVVPGGQVNVD